MVGGDTGKEGIGYEELTLAFLLCGPYEVGACEYVNFEKAREWEINPKLFNSKILQIPFTIDVDFFIKTQAVYHIFFCKSSRKLEKNSPKEYFEKALSTFCVLESRGKEKFQDNFKYYFFSDAIPWHLVKDLPTRDTVELSATLLKSMGCKNTEKNRQMFSQPIIAAVKQKTRFCQIDEALIKERKPRFPQFDDIVSQIAQAKREVEQAISGLSSDSGAQVSLGKGSNHLGKQFTVGKTTFSIGNYKQILSAAKSFQKSNKELKIFGHLIDEFKFSGSDEPESIAGICILFNDIVFPQNNLEISMAITLNNYDIILFKHRKLSDLIWEKLDRKQGKYNLSNVDVLRQFDEKTAVAIAMRAFSKGRSTDLMENKFIVRTDEM